MTNRGRSCLTLVAFGGFSATIAGGILVASAATAETAKTPSEVAAVVAASAVAAPTAPPGARLPENATGAEQLSTTGKFYGTHRELDHALRASMIAPYDPEDDSRITMGAVRADVIAVGPTPCDSCDPLDLDNPLSPDYDPTILAIYQEDDLLAPPEGPGFATCGGLSATGPFWSGANDQCWLNNIPGEDADNVERQIPTLTSIGQHYTICGQLGRIDTTGFTGDPNHPGGALRTEDADIWELHVTTYIDVSITGYFQEAGLRFVMCFNGILFQEEGVFGQFRDCDDNYYQFNGWQSIGFESTVPCGDLSWSEELWPGYHFMLLEPRTTAPQGVPGAQLCEYWYNIEIETTDPIGACCIGAACTDDVAKMTCFGVGGVFRGRSSSCNFSICCDVLAELAGEGLTADYTEGDTGFNPFTEERCNIVGSADTNPGCQRDEDGLPIPGFPDAGEPVQNGSGQLLDVCADPDKFVIVGYSGTLDAFEATFLASQFSESADGDVFVFENNSGASQSLTFDGFAAASGVWQLQVNAGSYPDAGAFAYSCDISSFIAALMSPCERISIADCIPDDTTWSFGFRNFETDGISCDTPYWFSIDCTPCPQVACCLPNGSCVDGLDAAECNNFLDPGAAGGVEGVPWSSCCYAACPNVCNGPSGEVADDDCTTVNPSIGDLFNSGCDAPDGNPVGKFSTIDVSSTSLPSWCGSTGSYVLSLPSEAPTVAHAETDYYIFYSVGGNDIGVRITVTPASSMSLFIVPNRGEGDCPTMGLDGTSDVRELDDTMAYTLPGGVETVVNVCLAGYTPHMFLFESDGLVGCGAPYTVDILRHFSCVGACCNAYLNNAGSGPQGCSNLSDLAATVENEGLVYCSSSLSRGTYRGLNSYCNQIGFTCCTVPAVGGDIQDSDNNVCPATNATNGNRGCIAPIGPGSFQSLGNLTPGVGPNPGSTIRVWGSTCKTVGGSPTIDYDFYSVNVNSAGGAEYLCTVDSNALVAISAYNAVDLGLAGANCNITSADREILFNPTNPCAGPVTVAGSGFSVEGESICLLGNQLNYFLVQPTVPNDGVEAQYRMTLTAYECRVGACCLDAALCFDNSGFLECEAVSGGQFIAGASCPDDAAGMALCRGVCCVDTGPGPPVCVPNTTAYDCCVLLNDGSFAFDSGFAGYSAGDLAFDIDCVNNPDICEEGACCVDSVSGYTCQDNLTAAQCGSLSGLYQGIGTNCADVTCPVHPCCFGLTCADGFSPLECSNAGGTYKPLLASCAGIGCTPTGACCFSCAQVPTNPCPDPSGPIVNCVNLTLDQCYGVNGAYAGNGTTCTQGIGGPCDCPGDANGDGKTNTSDFNAVAGGFGNPGPNCYWRQLGDLNCDGMVNTADFNIMASNFGCVRD